MSEMLTLTTALSNAQSTAYQLFNTSASVYEMTKRGLNGNVGAHGEPPVGLNYHEEMWFFSQGGMTPYEVGSILQSYTKCVTNL